ncbi:MAG: AMP-binding protein [Campylobacter sp.]|nr:AMP-binding protein [Campylobacter sp.]
MQKIINSNFRILKNKKEISKDELLENISLFASALKKQNLDEIEIYLSDNYDFLVAFLAAMSLNLKVFILQKESLNDKFNISDKNFKEILQSANGEKSKLDTNPQNIFYMQTSGSSSVAKKIPKSLEQMINEAHALQDMLALKKDDKIVANIPFQHLFGLTFKIFLPLVNGGVIENETLLYPEDFMLYAKNSEDFTLLSTATALNVLLKHDLSDIKSIKRIITAGSKLPEQTRKDVNEKLPNTELIEIYGSTETGVIARNKGDGLVLFKGVKASLDKDERLIIDSPWQKNAILKDEFVSNDCARIDGDKIVLLGRSDRMVKLHEKRFNLDSVEAVIRANELIDECYVGLEDDKTRFSALLTLSDEGKEAFRNGGKLAITNSLKAELNKHFGNEIRYFYIRNTLPYNAQGKITKADFLAECKKLHRIEFEDITVLPDTISAKAFISPSCFYFDGHFANFPVLPGFVQIGLVYELLEQYNILRKQICEIESAKFTSLVRPFDEINIEIKKQDKIYFEITKNYQICASGRLVLCK